MTNVHCLDVYAPVIQHKHNNNNNYYYYNKNNNKKIIIIIIVIIINNNNNTGRKIFSTSGDERKRAFLYQKVSVLVQRYNVVLLHDTWPAPDCMD